MIKEKKYYLHCNDSGIGVYEKKEKFEELFHINSDFVTDPFSILIVIKEVFSKLGFNDATLDSKCFRLYATDVFNRLPAEKQMALVVDFFVDFGLYFNIIARDLECFYLEKSEEINGRANIMDGIQLQEFRNVVICGSFQQHLAEIGEIRDHMLEYDIDVLSPWTTKVVPATLGTDFILLEGQAPLKNSRDAWRHKLEHMEKFRNVDAIIVCNPGGIVGQGTTFEFGYMIANSKRIIFLEEPKNILIPFPYEVGLNF